MVGGGFAQPLFAAAWPNGEFGAMNTMIAAVIVCMVAGSAIADEWPTCAELRALHAFSGGPIGRFGQSTRIYRRQESDDDRPLPVDACDPSGIQRDCTDLESLDMFRDRGWVVLRGLMPPDERAALVATTPTRHLCSPQKPRIMLSPTSTSVRPDIACR